MSTDTPEATASDVTPEVNDAVEPETANDLGELAEGQELTPEPNDQSFTIPYKGEEIEVTLDELKNGYLRQNDYTIKTQEIAGLKAFNEAFQKDPAGVIKMLAEENGLTLSQARTQANALVDDFDELDPFTQRLNSVEASIAAQAQSAQEAQIRAEATQAIANHKELAGLTPEALVEYAWMNGITGNLETAARLRAIEIGQEEAARNTAQVIAKKRDASVVAGGSAAQSGVVNESFDNKSFGEIAVSKLKAAGLM